MKPYVHDHLIFQVKGKKIQKDIGRKSTATTYKKFKCGEL